MQKILALCFVVLSFSNCNQNTETEKTKQVIDTVVKPAEPIAKIDVPIREVLLKQITDLEKELYTATELNADKAKKIISLYESFYQNYHTYPECPEYLFKAAELAENIEQPYRAIDFYTICYEDYPVFKLNAECLFRMANLYDFKLSNYIKAKALYMEVKVKFPKTHWAEDAEAAIKLMGKTDTEMMKEFDKKNKKTNSK